MNPDSPPELERIVDKALEKDRKLRYQSAADIRTDLQRLKRDSRIGTAASSNGRSKWRRQEAWDSAGRCLSLAALVGCGNFGWRLLLFPPHARS